MKTLLGVRPSTTNMLSLVEMGISSMTAYIKEKQYNSYKRLLDDNSRIMNEDPFLTAYNIGIIHRNKYALYIKKLITSDNNFIIDDIAKMRQQIRDSDSSRSKFRKYLEINPTLQCHEVYLSKNADYNELQRIEFTKFRLSSHNLKIELGRWTRPITLPNERL